MCGKHQVKENQESLPRISQGLFFNALTYVECAGFLRTLLLVESSRSLGSMQTALSKIALEC